MINLSRRSEQIELMDDFHEGLTNLRNVFDDINRVNRLLGGNKITTQAVAALLEEYPQRTYTIVDMGCGDGNILRELADYCRRNKLKVNLIGVDLNNEALLLAREASSTYPEIRYLNEDILLLDPKELACDIVINTLTMHHFTDTKLPVFLQKFIDLASIGVVINDLHRSRWAYYLFKAFSCIFIKTKVAKIDGLISISKGFIKADLEGYAKIFPAVSHHIQWKWAFRYVWVMRHVRLS